MELVAGAKMIWVWLYVSGSRIAEDQASVEVEKIVTVSRARNSQLDVTGALIFTGTRFAQLLEGPVESVDHLRDSILNDVRHGQVTTVCMGARSGRLFNGWSLVYSGASRYMANMLDQVELGKARAHRQACDELLHLFQEFAQTEGLPRRTDTV